MTNYLLDTNALSEAPKKAPNSGFMGWFMATDELRLFTSCLVLGEIRKGIALSGDSDKRQNFDKWLDEIIDRFDGRIVGLDKDIALLWGDLIAVGQQHGRIPPVIDALIAAQCIHSRMTLVTRNIRDFEQFSDLLILCPWTDNQS
jgi:toxin FitB